MTGIDGDNVEFINDEAKEASIKILGFHRRSARRTVYVVVSIIIFSVAAFCYAIIMAMDRNVPAYCPNRGDLVSVKGLLKKEVLVAFGSKEGGITRCEWLSVDRFNDMRHSISIMPVE